MPTLLLKIFGIPFLLSLSQLLFHEVQYSSYTQIGFVGIIVAFVSCGTDLYGLGGMKLSALSAAIVDVVVVAFLVWMSQLLFPLVRVGIVGALMTGILIGLFEYVVHRWLIKNGMVRGRG